MLQPPNCIWKCEKCNEEISGYLNDNQQPPKCPKCGEHMKEKPFVRRGPYSDEHPWKKY